MYAHTYMCTYEEDESLKAAEQVRTYVYVVVFRVCVCVYIYIYIYIFIQTYIHSRAEDSRRGGHRHVCIVVYVYTCIHTKQIKELKTAKEVHTRMCVYDFYYVYVCLI